MATIEQQSPVIPGSAVVLQAGQNRQMSRPAMTNITPAMDADTSA